MRVFVRTNRGAGFVTAQPLVHSGAIILLLSEANLRAADASRVLLPAGTLLRRDKTTERRTKDKPPAEQRTHQIVEEGIHHLHRLCCHVRTLGREERREMLLRRDQIQKVGEALWKSGRLSLEDHRKLTVAIEDVRQSFDEWKRNPHKQTVRARLDTTGRQKTKAGRFKPAPAGLTAFASTTHINRRLKEIVGIHAALNVHVLCVEDTLQETWGAIDFTWNFLQRSLDSALMPLSIAQAMAGRTRSYAIVGVAERRVREQIRNMQDIKVQPYLSLAQAVCDEFKRIHFAVREHRKPVAAEAIAKARFLVRRMRMLWYVERSLIEVLSFGPTGRSQTLFAERLEKALQRVNNLSDQEFDPELRMLVGEYLDAAQANVKLLRFEDARRELKRLTHELRVLPTVSAVKAA